MPNLNCFKNFCKKYLNLKGWERINIKYKPVGKTPYGPKVRSSYDGLVRKDLEGLGVVRAFFGNSAKKNDIELI